MTTNPYSTNNAPSSYTPSNRRPSYATVAAGGGASHINPARFNTLQAAIQTSSAMAQAQSQSQPPQHHLQPTRQRSRGSIKSMEIDGQGSNGTWKRPASSWSTDLARLDGRMGCPLHEEHPPFFTPSYLRASRHVERLHKAWNEHVAELQEEMHLNPLRPPQQPLSASSSNVNLSKMHSSHVHRGVVQDVIERLPPPTEEDRSHPLPSKFNEEDKMSGLEILADGSEMRFNGVTKTQDEAASARADHAMPRECGLYYYEVTVLSRGKDAFIGVGFSDRKVNLNRLPGWEADSWAYHGDDGYSFACTASGKAYGPRFAAQDVVGCGVNFRTGNAFFTKNGVHLGIKSDRLYPSVGMKKPGDHVRVNFGRYPFVFDIDRMMEQERQTIMDDISVADLKSLHPPDDENALIHNLIGQYLAHEGYVETAKAFAMDVNDQQRSLSSDSKMLQLPDSEDDVHAANRQRIRKAILDGNIDHALKCTNSFYPHVLEEERNHDIDFRLRCRKFIEMMRLYTQLSTSATTSTFTGKSADSLASNGHLNDGGGIEVDSERSERDEPTDTQMELDDQLHREASKALSQPSQTDDVDMDTEPEDLGSSKANLMKQNELLAEALSYGRELQSLFGSDPRPQVKKQLSDIFAIVAYPNPLESSVGGLLDPRGRGDIAEDLNGAILGKPSSAALEKLSAQTEALLDEAAGKTGGAAAFINVRKDFLQA